MASGGFGENDGESGQEQWLETEYPWMAMVGCNFSVLNGPAISFHEQFVGWGTEDKEFAYRLVHEHGYQIDVSPAATGIHIGFPSHPSSLNPLWQNDPRGIAELMRNRLLFRRLHPNADLAPVLEGLLCFYLDATTDTWYVAQPDENRTLHEVLRLAEQWLDAHGIPFRPDDVCPVP